MRILIILFLCCGSFLTAFGQQICYDEQLREGDAFAAQTPPQLQEAINSWKSGLKYCRDLTTSQRTTLNNRIQNAEARLNPTPSVTTPVTTTPTRLSYEPETVFVQGGKFQMGSNDGDSDEKPVHTVKLSNFYMGKYEITVAQFKAFIDDTNTLTDAEKDDGSYIWSDSKWVKKAGINWRHDEEGNTRPSSEYNQPVVHVSWTDATAYCAWLSRKTGKKYRLPTEAEWEYAAGNGAKHTKYCWGNNDPSGRNGGNVADETAKTKFSSWTIFSGYTDGYVYSSSVGQFKENDFGLFDMTGNVWEWCSDWKGEYSSSEQENPTGAVTGSYRVNRGGSWYSNPTYCRVADRGSNAPAFRGNYIGFRLAYSLQ